MAFTGLLLKGAGPFEELWLDLSDGKGNPHLGPHVIAGVNGSGKSTVLRGLAWTVSYPWNGGFPIQDWSRSVEGWPQSGAVVEWSDAEGVATYAAGRFAIEDRKLPDWLRLPHWGDAEATRLGQLYGMNYGVFASGVFLLGSPVVDGVAGCRALVVGYSPNRVLRHIPRTEPWNARQGLGTDNALSFDKTVENGITHAWLKDLLSRVAWAERDGQSNAVAVQARNQIESALSSAFETEARLDAEIEKGFELRFKLGSQRLDFSQLPDGVRNLLGLVVDFVRRRDTANWQPEFAETRPGVLLVDEVDAHLHPKWQRTVLPALKAAFPDVQIIVTTHSPFVISSCEEAKIHVLDLDEKRRGYLKETMDAPVGDSVMATVKDVFGVSWYSVQTERKLKRWNELRREEAIGPLGKEGKKELDGLVEDLGRRSEELALIVGHPELMGEE